MSHDRMRSMRSMRRVTERFSPETFGGGSSSLLLSSSSSSRHVSEKIEDGIKKRISTVLLPKETMELAGRKGTTMMMEKSFSSSRKHGRGGCCCFCLMLRPESARRMTWDVMTLVFLAYISLLTPVRIGFEYDTQDGSAMYYWELLIDVFFMLDILVNFRTGYLKKDGTVEMRCKPIAKNYLKTYFLIDFLSSFPIDWVMASLENLQSAKVLKAGKILKVSRVLKLAKLARLMKLPTLMERFEDEVNLSTIRLKLLRILLTTSLIAHLNACGWAFVARTSDDFYVQSWASNYGIVDSDVASQYLAALYWAITTMTTVGYGDVIPASNAERIYALLSMIFGGAFYAYVIATLSSIVTNKDANQRLISERMDSILTYMRVRKFPKQLFRRVRKYYKHYYEMKTAINEATILQELSPGLRSEVALFLIDQTVSSNPLFQDMSAKSFSKLLTILYPIKLEEEEVLFFAGQIGEEMYLVISGTLEVFNDQGQVLAQLGSGSYFGELCALGLTKSRTCSIRATEASELYSLSKADFFETFLESEPETVKRMMEVAIRTYQDVNLDEMIDLEELKNDALLATVLASFDEQDNHNNNDDDDHHDDDDEEEEEDQEEATDSFIIDHKNPTLSKQQQQQQQHNNNTEHELIAIRESLQQLTQMLGQDPRYSAIITKGKRFKTNIQGRVRLESNKETPLDQSDTYDQLMKRKFKRENSKTTIGASFRDRSPSPPKHTQASFSIIGRQISKVFPSGSSATTASQRFNANKSKNNVFL